MKYLNLLLLLLLFSLTACVYEPEQFETSAGGDSDAGASTAMGALFPVNGEKQICNPSVSQDTVHYPASMLWLNFGGKLNVKAPDSIYTVSKVVQHDRLTVSDTAGNVLWYLMRDTEAGDCQFQDPEWSTHPEFVVALRAYDTKGSKACESLDYGIFAARLKDKKKFFFYKKGVGEFATPHLWVSAYAASDSSEVDTSVADSTVKGFFGTEQVRLVYVNKKDQIEFVDFAKGTAAITLKKPSGVEGWMMDSPLISPEGDFVVYNMVDGAMTGWKSFIQELSASASPIEIEKTTGMMSAPVQPHWFKFNNRLFVVWTEFPQGSQFVNKNDLSASSVQEGSAGRTAMREVSLTKGAPADLAFAWLGNPIELAPIPLIGGRSPDGRFMATGTNNGYLLKLP